jgi:CheY-like chemotaxis protein
VSTSDPNRAHTETWPLATESSPQSRLSSGVRSAAVLLVVDDDDDNRELTQEYLERVGYRTLGAANGSQALEAVGAGRVSAVLLDVVLPDMSGREVLLALREHHGAEELPIIMTTALGGAADIVDYLRLGASDYVVKPLELAVVEARVAKCLQRKRQSQALSDLLEALSGIEGRIADLVAPMSSAVLNGSAHWTCALGHELSLLLETQRIGIWPGDSEEHREPVGQLARPGDDVWARLREEECVREEPILYFAIVGRLDRMIGVVGVEAVGMLDRERGRALARFGRRLGQIVDAVRRTSTLPSDPALGTSATSRVLLCGKCNRCYPEMATKCDQDGTPLHPFRPRIPYRLAERYRLVQQAGHGSMGDVFRAHDEVLDRDVAVKILKAEFANDLALRRRFEIEAKASAALRDPGIVPVFDLVHDEDHLFIVMEWLDGVELAQLLKEQGQGSSAQVAMVLVQAGKALECAHNAGFVHRDVKPANLFIQASPEGLRTRLLDFGIAKMTSFDKSLTRPGGLIGTPQYMAPEQIAGGSVDARSDIFSLALVGLEALTGRNPRRHGTLYEVLACTGAAWTSGLRLIDSGSPQLDRHFSKGLQWASRDRPDSALRWAARAAVLMAELPTGREWSLLPRRDA